VVVEKGVLRSFLCDTYWGRRAGVPSTGNGLRAGYRSPPFVSPTNLFLEPGERSLEEIVASVDDGVLLLEAMNVGGVDVASGDYSVAATGVRIERGELTSPVSGITVAGRLPEMLRHVAAVGCDLKWQFSVASPTIAVEGMTAGG
jgi:PmbA protein